MNVDFETGKLSDVVRTVRPYRYREYGFLILVCAVTCIPYCLWIAMQPVVATCFILYAALFKVGTTFVTSLSTDTAHHVRFLLAGSNPVGMTGGCSLLLGAVDSILDWQEDSVERRTHPVKYTVSFVTKWLLTPLGLVMLTVEFAWDLLLLRRGMRLIKFKRQEFFSLAYYHDWICPEKSNDIFYADMAYARYRNDPFFYQWNRLRAFAFELQHYRLDLNTDAGVPETNLLRQDAITAFQTMKRLKIEELEEAVDVHFRTHRKSFPFPEPIASRLIAQARPLMHYLRHRDALLTPAASTWPHKMAEDFALLTAGSPDPDGHPTGSPAQRDFTWHVLRLLDANQSTFGVAISRYITPLELHDLVRTEIIERAPSASDDPSFRFRHSFLTRLESFLEEYFEPASADARQRYLVSRLPTLLTYTGVVFVPKHDSLGQSSNRSIL